MKSLHQRVDIMARKTVYLEIASGRDEGKKFMIKEMSAFDTEVWALGALRAFHRSALEDEYPIVMGVNQTLMHYFGKPKIKEVTELKFRDDQGNEVSLDANSPEVQKANEQKAEEIAEQQRIARESDPMRLLANIGLSFFFRLSKEDQDDIRLTMLSTCSFRDPLGIDFPLIIDDGQTKIFNPELEDVVEDMSTLQYLFTEAFKVHADFFIDVGRSYLDMTGINSLASFQQ